MLQRGCRVQGAIFPATKSIHPHWHLPRWPLQEGTHKWTGNIERVVGHWLISASSIQICQLHSVHVDRSDSREAPIPSAAYAEIQFRVQRTVQFGQRSYGKAADLVAQCLGLWNENSKAKIESDFAIVGVLLHDGSVAIDVGAIWLRSAQRLFQPILSNIGLSHSRQLAEGTSNIELSRLSRPNDRYFAVFRLRKLENGKLPMNPLMRKVVKSNIHILMRIACHKLVRPSIGYDQFDLIPSLSLSLTNFN